MMAFLNAELRPGVDIVMDAVGIDEALQGADLVLVGEGEVDFQTVYNKAPIGVDRKAKRLDIPVVAISGGLGEGYKAVHERGIDAAVSIQPGPMSLHESSQRASELIANSAEADDEAYTSRGAVIGETVALPYPTSTMWTSPGP